MTYGCFCSFPAQHTIRALALRVLKEILRSQPARFRNYAELTIMKTLEAHKDSHKEVRHKWNFSVLLAERKLSACW